MVRAKLAIFHLKRHRKRKRIVSTADIAIHCREEITVPISKKLCVHFGRVNTWQTPTADHRR